MRFNKRRASLVVDSPGLPIAINVSAPDVHDSVGAFDLLWKIGKVTHRMKLIRTDKAYRGKFSEVDEKYYKWRREITQKLPSVKGFIPQTGRWQVERSFAWLNFFRRLDKAHEKLPCTSVAFMQLCFGNTKTHFLMLRIRK